MAMPPVKPKLLDLFCGAGGAAMGYHLAGFDVIGVDLNPKQLDVYPFPCLQADATDPPIELNQFAAIHASPPCQAYSTATNSRGHPSQHPDLMQPVREYLIASGKPFIIENVPGAPMRPDVRLCGSAFDLRVRRHRWFELGNWFAWAPPVCQHGKQRRTGGVVEVAGNAGGPNQQTRAGKPLKYRDADHARQVMQMPWSTRYGCTQAIPPAYTQWLGQQLIGQL